MFLVSQRYRWHTHEGCSSNQCLLFDFQLIVACVISPETCMRKFSHPKRQTPKFQCTWQSRPTNGIPVVSNNSPTNDSRRITRALRVHWCIILRISSVRWKHWRIFAGTFAVSRFPRHVEIPRLARLARNTLLFETKFTTAPCSFCHCSRVLSDEFIPVRYRLKLRQQGIARRLKLNKRLKEYLVPCVVSFQHGLVSTSRGASLYTARDDSLSLRLFRSEKDGK